MTISRSKGNAALAVNDLSEDLFIPVSEPNLSALERGYVSEAMESGWISSKGDFLDKFEASLSRYFGSLDALAFCNGTCALHAALAAAGIQAGDEVIVPTFTYIASANAVRYTGATPVFVDMDPQTWNAPSELVERAITEKTKAIVPVHLYGHPCDMDPLMEIARKHNLLVIEDAAEAFGSLYKSRKVGTFGDIGIFSLYGNKTITTGEGGILITSNKEFASKARLLRGQGMSPTKQYFFEIVGHNYRMTNLQAAIGLGQIQRIDDLVASKRKNASLYLDLLANVEGITLPVEKSYALNTYWMFCILVEKAFGRTRDEVGEMLMGKGIQTRPFFFPCHTMPPYKQVGRQFPVAEEISAKGLNLPSSTVLIPEQIEYIVESLKSCRLK